MRTNIRDVLPVIHQHERKYEPITAFQIDAPDGYDEFLNLYGCGCVDDFLWVFSPDSPSDYRNLIFMTPRVVEVFQELACEFETFCPPLFPDMTTLLCLGMSDNGDYLCGRKTKEGLSEIYVIESRAPEFFRYEGSFLDLLTLLLTKEVMCPVFPSSFPSDKPLFRSESAYV